MWIAISVYVAQSSGCLQVWAETDVAVVLANWVGINSH